LVLYAILTKPLVESAKIPQELPIYPLFRRSVASELVPDQPGIDRFRAKRAEMAGNLIEISKYPKRTFAGIT